MRTLRRTALRAALGAACLALPPGGAAPADAQGYRAEVRVRGDYIELRGLRRDSLPEEEVPGEGLRRRLTDGTIVTCTPGQFCRWFASAETDGISLLTQDVSVAAWPGTVRGLSFHGHVRGRVGSEEFWPRTAQELDVLSAFARYDHRWFQARAGRQERADGLGYFNFDGFAVTWKGFAPARLEAFGGWSLARGVNGPRTGDLLEEADVFAPDDRGLLFGVKGSARWGHRLAGSLVYQREIREDELALYSERLAGNVRALFRGVAVDGSLRYDFAFEEFNEARLRLTTPLPAELALTVEGRHYTPYFELWTIWGLFSPVGFDEGRAAVSWSAPLNLRLQAGGAYRSYEDTHAEGAGDVLKDYGWRVFGSAGWSGEGWYADGTYRAETGFGSVRYGGDAAVGRRFGRRGYVSLRGTSTQTFGEFRFGEQTVTGGGIDGSWRVGEWRVDGSIGLYRLTFENRPSVEDWTQTRAHLGISYAFGTDTGEGGGYR